jgi:L-iditol 2-dehydrogenase
VAVDPLVTCGKCDQCTGGRKHTCRNQVFLGVPDQLPGSLVESLVLPGTCCYPIPDSMTMEQAALIEPFAIGLYTQRRAGTPNAQHIAILGTGPIGLSVLASLKAAGPSQIYATDLLDNRLQLAAHLGADWTGNASRDDVVGAMTELHPLGMDYVFECAGKQETLDQGVQLLRPGGTLLIVGIPEYDRVSFDMNYLRRKELTLLNIRRQNECVEAAIELVAGGKVDLDPLVTHHFEFGETKHAFDTVADYNDGVVKAMIHVSQ